MGLGVRVLGFRVRVRVTIGGGGGLGLGPEEEEGDIMLREIQLVDALPVLTLGLG